jgi:hypothetical protein
MLIRNIYLVDRNVRIYDVDGSHIEIGVDDAIDLEGWLMQNHGKLLDILRIQIAEEQRRKENVH